MRALSGGCVLPHSSSPVSNTRGSALGSIHQLQNDPFWDAFQRLLPRDCSGGLGLVPARRRPGTVLWLSLLFLLLTLPAPHLGKRLWFAGNCAGCWGRGAVGAGGWGERRRSKEAAPVFQDFPRSWEMRTSDSGGRTLVLSAHLRNG